MPIALVTGGAKRIGRCITEALANNGYDIALHYHTAKAEAEVTADIVRQCGRQVKNFAGDMTDIGMAQDLWQNVTQNFGVPCVYVNAASLFERDDMLNFSLDLWEKHIRIHCTTPLEITRLLAQDLPKTQTGSVVHLIDQRVERPNPDFFSYTASKMLCKSLTQLCAMSLAPHIRVNAISPGPVLQGARQTTEDFMRQADMTPLGLPVTPDSVAGAVLFLVQTPSITGQIITIDSGQSLDWRTSAFLKTVE